MSSDIGGAGTMLRAIRMSPQGVLELTLVGGDLVGDLVISRRAVVHHPDGGVTWTLAAIGARYVDLRGETVAAQRVFLHVGHRAGSERSGLRSVELHDIALAVQPVDGGVTQQLLTDSMTPVPIGRQQCTF
ncbi:hypothetical protein [Mycobacterium antarcticum]|uniref:hypothetical protein n=1 Tax=Mycolicibacterium sp. TUM20983 TaxID=3023369 RepID=UPI0024E144D1|nr:hypothetical protein [Mycolicibacterium sp. TUM20983]